MVIKRKKTHRAIGRQLKRRRRHYRITKAVFDKLRKARRFRKAHQMAVRRQYVKRKLLTTAQVAAQCGVTKRTVSLWLKAGLPFLGQRHVQVLISRPALKRWLRPYKRKGKYRKRNRIDTKGGNVVE